MKRQERKRATVAAPHACWILAGALVAWVAWSRSVSAQHPDPGMLGIELEAYVDGNEVTFKWRFDRADGVVIVCTLDADGDQIYEQSIPNCHEEMTTRHTYEDTGVYFARLLANTRDGRSGQAVVRVDVE